MMVFFRLCARWYNRSSWGRLWSSIKDPFELKYKDLVADIGTCSALVEKLANTGERVEIRNIHALTEIDHALLLEIDRKMVDAFDAQMAKLESIEKGVSRICDGQMALINGQNNRQRKLDHIDVQVVELFNGQSKLVDGQSQLFEGQTRLEAGMTQIHQVVTSNQTTLNSMHRALYRLEFHHILELFTPKMLPGTALSKVQPLSQRQPTMSDRRLERKLRDWGSNKSASILVLHAGTRAPKQTTELAADVVNHLRANAQYVFWNISSGVTGRSMTIADVFRSIIFQALQQMGSAFEDMGEQLHPQKIHGSHDDREWVDLICLLFAKIPKAFVIIETKDIRSMYGDDQQWADQLLNSLKIIVDHCAAAGCRLKVLLIMYGSKASAAPNGTANKNLQVATLLPPQQVPQRLRRKAGSSGLSMKGWDLGSKKLVQSSKLPSI